MFKNIICTDPDEKYLTVVQSICELGELNTKNFKTGLFPCDYCYYDYGNKERIPNLKKAIELTRKALYIDDCDTRPECKELRDYIYSLGYNVKDCSEAKDIYGRWGVILTK